MKENDLVVVTKRYFYNLRYSHPEQEKQFEITAGTIGMIIECVKGFVWVVTPNSAFQAQRSHLRVIGETTPTQLFGYTPIDWSECVGDEYGVWLDKSVMYLDKQGEPHV